MPYDSPEDEGYFAAIGRLAVAWAQLETGIDGLVWIVHHCELSEEREMPRALGRKIDYLRDAFKPLELPSQDLLTAIKTESETRHDIIHGFAVDHLEGSGKATLIRLLRSKNDLHPKKVHVTTISILQAGVRAQEMTAATINLILNLLQLPAARSRAPAMSSDPNQLSVQEIERRRDEAVRRALSTPPKPHATLSPAKGTSHGGAGKSTPVADPKGARGRKKRS